MASRWIYRAIWIPSALACLGCGIYFLTQPLAMAKPGPLKSYRTGDKALTLDRPDNWKPMAFAAHAVQSEVKFQPNLFTNFRASCDLQGSLMGDLAKSGNNMMDNLAGDLPEAMKAQLPKQKSPLEAVHELQAKEMSKQYKDMAEGQTKKTQLAGLEALETDFTAQDGQLVGRRISALAQDSRVSVAYSCLKTSKATYYPVFEKMAKSLKVAPNGGAQ